MCHTVPGWHTSDTVLAPVVTPRHTDPGWQWFFIHVGRGAQRLCACGLQTTACMCFSPEICTRSGPHGLIGRIRIRIHTRTFICASTELEV